MSDDAASHPEFDQFLAEYYAECDEHLEASRRSLLVLETAIGQADLPRPVLDELFRSFHSIKGLSAMVGIGTAEALAHHLESYLGELRRGKLLLSPRGIDALIAGVKTLDQLLAARRAQAPEPRIAPVQAELANLIKDSAVASPTPAPPAISKSVSQESTVSPEAEAQITAKLKPGARAWSFVFVPSPELSAKGVNVNSVRSRLQQIGDILQAAPVVRPGGQISFSFIVGTTEPEAAFQAWQNEGISYSEYAGKVAAAESKTQPSLLPSPAPSAATPVSNVVRVDLTRLDDLMQKVGELVLSRARLEESVRRLRSQASPTDWRALQETNQAMERQLRDLREGIMRVRMVPFREIFARMQFVIRDLAHEFHKRAKLELAGEETEIDKFLVERMMDPLLHLVRNAISHGLESPKERLAAGKAADAKIALRARTNGETVTLEVEDDGRGIDLEQVFARARATGIVSPDAPADSELLLEILCTPGFSSREEADRLSGRGVGMDVVRRAVEELNGSLALETVPGKGTRFVIELPLTLAIADALIVSVDGEKYAVLQAAIREVLQIAPTAVHALEHNELISYRAGVLPLLRLTNFFGSASRPEGDCFVLVLGEGLHAVGITVDRILGLREIVVRPVTDELIQVDGIAGATELGDGRVVLILDTSSLTRVARRHDRGNRSERSDSSARAGLAGSGFRKGA